MSAIPTKEEMLESIEADAAVYFDGGRQNNIADIVLAVCAIVSSLATATVAATELCRWIRVGVAAVPVAFTSIQRLVDVRARSNWYFNYAAQLGALAMTLRYATSPDLEEFAKKRAAIELDMELGWRQIGRIGNKSASRAKKP